MTERTYKISGLDCMECARGLEASVAQLTDVDEARIEFFNGTLFVRGEIDEKSFRKIINSLGYDILDEQSSPSLPVDEPNVVIGFWRYLLRQQEARLALIAGVLILLAFILKWSGLPNWTVNSLQIGALLLAGWPIARSGIVNLWVNRTFNINFLMTLAAIGAVVIGEYAEAATLIFLFDIAEALEGFTNDRARRALSHLSDLIPDKAILLKDGKESVVAVETLELGDRIVVRPGERIPLDGMILEGESDINQAPITGESLPAIKNVGDQVFSGTVNGHGRLILEVTHLVADSILHRIIQMVTEAQSRQSRSQKFIDRFAKYYTPAMVILAILIATIPPLVFGEPFLHPLDGSRGWLYRALVLLVIGCPCALVISTPVTMAASLTRAAREGVLFKGGVFVELLSKIKAFAFDKTGTLTHGEPKVVACRDLGCKGDLECEACDDLVALAYALENHSTHPLAQAVIEEARERGVIGKYPPALNLTTRGGLGLEGVIHGEKVTIGNLRLFEEEHLIPDAVRKWVVQTEAEGNTAMLICDGKKVRGFIAVADTPRHDAREVVETLGDLDKHVAMLTGDNAIVASVVAEKLGLQDVRSGLLPEDKLDEIAKLKDQYGAVAMVGDGINDAPALASSDLGIAIGGSGSAQAMETADVALMADGINKLPFAVKLSEFTNRLIRQNIAFSLISKLAVAVIAFLGYAPLWLAVFADMGVSLLVTLNGLRAIRFRGGLTS
ncbi:MAG: heavy metal translocating P-type ATPase [Brevefilum sp.]|jgi:Cd2+/Zn2+-exporting ATPase